MRRVGCVNARAARSADGYTHRVRHRIDITREVCPMTYVRVKLAIETLDDGATLEVLLRGAEPLKNVPRSAREDGHEVLSLTERDGISLLTLVVRHQER